MLSGEGNEIGLITKKATLHLQHTFFVHFFAVVLHDYNVKLQLTSGNFVVARFMEEMVVRLVSFFTASHIHLRGH